MPLQAMHETIEEIPEQYQDLYTEKNGKFELTGIVGVKSQADIDRLSTALNKEREEHKGTKDKFSIWGDMDHDDVQAKLDRYPELEAAAAGKLDDNAIEEMVTRRVDGTITSRTAPLERQVKSLSGDYEAIKAERDSLLGEKRTRAIHDTVRQQLVGQKVIAEAHEDALMLADAVFEIREDDGQIVTKDGVGVIPGMSAELWLQEMQDKRPHWWPASVGGGAAGAGRGGSGLPSGSSNPFSGEGWNLTKQGEVLRTQGREKADNMARAAGTTVGGPRPQAKS